MRKKWPIVVGVLLVILAGMFIAVTNGLSEGAKVSIDGIDLSDVPDGSYTGVYDFKRWSNTVEVHVKDHRITAVDIVKGLDVPDCAGEIIRRVIEAQDTTVDTVSGATVTSKAYLKAIENALIQGR